MNTNPLRLALICFLASLALSPAARAVDPPPDGGYPNGNTAEGEDALFRLTYGVNNTGIGFQALYNNSKGYLNTAIGSTALYSNSSGFYNTASGYQSLYFNTAGKRNTATGLNALYANTTGSNNTAVGCYALGSNISGINNIAVGISAGGAIVTGSNNINIGNAGMEGDSKTIRIGDSHQIATHIAGISGATIASGVAVVIDGDGHLGTMNSSARYKEAIKPMKKSSEAILSLKPVSFRYKRELDPQGIPQFGLVAEDVAKVDPDLVARDEQGKPYTVRYEAVNAMLLNEFLKEHRRVRDLEAKVERLEKALFSSQANAAVR